MKFKLITLVLALALLQNLEKASAQDGQDPLLFSSTALRVGATEFPLSGAAALMPSVANNHGFASFLDNPASMAFTENSYFSIGLATLNRRDDITAYGNQGTALNRDPIINNNGLLSDLGFVVKLPTSTGNLVFGGGYSLQQDFFRANEFDAFNQNSSITDNFRLDGDQSIAFDVFGTDYGDTQQTFVESIFRVGQTSDLEFLGINQLGEIRQTGYMGELSVFGAVEFQKNLFVGVSLGATIGRYSYSRDFLEEDLSNIYNLDLIDDDNDPATMGTDIEALFFADNVNADISGFVARIGAIYKFDERFNVGGSITLPTKLTIEERFESTAASTFDNGFGLLSTEAGDFEYEINRPAKYSLGFSALGLGNVEFSAAADFIDYSQSDINTSVDQGLVIQNSTNTFIEDTFEDVINLRFGATYNLPKDVKLRGSYAYLPSKTTTTSLDRNIYGAGLTVPLNNTTFLDFAAQYSEFDDRSVLYGYENFDAQFVDEFIDEKIRRINLLVSIRVIF